MKNNETTRVRIPAFPAFVLLLAGVGVMFGLNYLWVRLIAPELSMELYPTLSSVISQMVVPYAVGLPLCALLYRLIPVTRCSAPECFGIRKLAGCTIVQTGCAVPLMFAANLIMLMSGAMEAQENSGVFSLYNAFLLLVFNPVMEELLFRRMIVDRLRVYGCKTAIALSAIIFAAPHIVSQGVGGALLTFVCGCVWGWVYYTTGQLMPCIGLHSVCNLLCSFVPALLTRSAAGTVIYMLIYLLVLPMWAVIIILRRRRTK